MKEELILVACLLVLLACIGVLGVVVKLYTEILKDRKFDVREVRSGHDGGRQVTPKHQPIDAVAVAQALTRE